MMEDKNVSFFIPGVGRLKVIHPITQPHLTCGKSHSLTLSPDMAAGAGVGGGDASLGGKLQVMGT